MTRCPSCDTPLRLVVESGVDIDVCDNCHGVWLDPGELDALASTTPFTPRQFAVDELSNLKCPRRSAWTFANIDTAIGPMARCADCGGVFVGGETLDALAKSERTALPSKETAETVVMSTELFRGVLEILWLFGRHQ